MLFVISGAAATGKSGLIKLLKGIDQKLACHDDSEMPAKDGTNRCQINEEWVKLALKAQDKGEDFLLAGQSPFGEILACPSATRLNGIKACLLDCHDFVRVNRYLSRPQFEECPLGMDTLCWAVFHRMHALNPQWEQRVIVKNRLPEFKWNRWTNWQKGDKRWDVKIIDTTDNSMKKTTAMVQEWIFSERKKHQLLTPEQEWWI